jgi:hypothetical protein
MMAVKYKHHILLVCLMTGKAADAQNAKGQPLAIIASSPAKTIQNADDLKFRVVIKNNSSNTIKIYKYLAEGYAEDPTKNLNLEVEQKGKSGYHSYSRG